VIEKQPLTLWCWSGKRPEAEGIQVVGGSNPLTPTIIHSQEIKLKFVPEGEQ